MASTLPMPALAAAAAPHPTITLLQTSSLSSVVQGELERMILSGELRPGEKLTEMALAARLGVSRGPVRESFRALEETGLVRIEKNRGVFVRELSVDEGADLLQRRRRDAHGKPAAHELVHRRAQVEDLDRFLDREAAHEHAPVLFGTHQPGFLEHAKGFTQRPAGDAEAGGEGDFGELFARRQLAGEDHPLELALHHARERAGLQERDGRMGRGRDSGDGSGHGGE